MSATPVNQGFSNEQQNQIRALVENVLKLARATWPDGGPNFVVDMHTADENGAHTAFLIECEYPAQQEIPQPEQEPQVDMPLSPASMVPTVAAAAATTSDSGDDDLAHAATSPDPLSKEKRDFLYKSQPYVTMYGALADVYLFCVRQARARKWVLELDEESFELKTMPPLPREPPRAQRANGRKRKQEDAGNEVQHSYNLRSKRQNKD